MLTVVTEALRMVHGMESDEDDAVPLSDGDDSSIVAAGTHNLGENVTYEQTGQWWKKT